MPWYASLLQVPAGGCLLHENDHHADGVRVLPSVIFVVASQVLNLGYGPSLGLSLFDVRVHAAFG